MKHEIRTLFSKKYFSRETLEIRKGLWNEVVRLQEEKVKFAVANYDQIYS